MSAATPEDTIREALESVDRWDRYSATVIAALAALSLLVADRDSLQATLETLQDTGAMGDLLAAAATERDAQEKVLAACARLLGDDMPAWAPLPVREIGCQRCEKAEADRDEALGFLSDEEGAYVSLRARLKKAEGELADCREAEGWLAGIEETFASPNRECAQSDPGEDNSCIAADPGDLEFPDDWCERCYVLKCVREARAALSPDEPPVGKAGT